MGAYAPAPVLTAELQERAMDEIVRPTARALAAAGTPFSGVLYAGLMLTAEGPKLIEYNVRFGDPECEAIMPLIDGDFAELLHAVATGRLGEIEPPELSRQACDDGDRRRARLSGHAGERRAIRAIEAAEQVEGVTVFHAGTALSDGGLVAKGGRVLAVTAVADTLRQRPGARLSRGRPDRLRRRLPPPRHRLARARAGRGMNALWTYFWPVVRGWRWLVGGIARLVSASGAGQAPRNARWRDRPIAASIARGRAVAWPARRRATGSPTQRRARRPGDARLLRDDAGHGAPASRSADART